MRAEEFIVESERLGKIRKDQQNPTRGLQKFRDNDWQDRHYEMNRLGMALAMTDGEITPVLDNESYIGKWNSAHPYTEVEAKMLKKAYKALGTLNKDLNNGDLKSKEAPGNNIESPIKPFKGYKKK